MILLAGALAVAPRPVAAQEHVTVPSPPPDVAGGEKAPGVQAGGTEIRLLNCHNEGSHIANGHQITLDGEPWRARRDRSPHLMGPANQLSTEFVIPEGNLLTVTTERYDLWIEQCTYRALLPVYEFDAVEDLAVGGQGSFAIVLRDAAGGALARHAWDPIWGVPDLEVERDALSFAFRLRCPNELARIELEGPDGLLDSRALSPSRPEVTILAPSTDAPVPLEGARCGWSGPARTRTATRSFTPSFTARTAAGRGGTWRSRPRRPRSSCRSTGRPLPILIVCSSAPPTVVGAPMPSFPSSP